MTNIREMLDGEKNANILSILETAGRLADKEGMEVYVVGGLVRDLMMGLPLNDIDIMTVGEGIPFAKKLSDELGVKKIIPFKKFGTAMIPNKSVRIEVATARTESYNDDSRKPSEVVYTDLKGDLLRRDFTINAMAMDILPDTFGNLTDPFGGIADINKKILRTPLDPDETFSEDPLRMMRAAYFASKLG